ncbi:MAG TPA: DoxX family protein [Ktedonobacterales bacterium]|nr:DoxX family protein [Ktedonobacterales bacterium]
MGTAVSISVLAFEGLFGLFMAYAVFLNFSNSPMLVKRWAELGMPRWYSLLAGVIGLIGAITLLAGDFFPMVGALAALWIVAYFLVATLTHVVLRDKLSSISIPLVFLALAIGLAALRWPDLAPALGTLHLG